MRDAHVPAALLKLWLRSLPEPLLPDLFYSRCLAVCDQPEEACRIVELLPTINRLVLAKLLDLLQVFLLFCHGFEFHLISLFTACISIICYYDIDTYL